MTDLFDFGSFDLESMTDLRDGFHHQLYIITSRISI